MKEREQHSEMITQHRVASTCKEKRQKPQNLLNNSSHRHNDSFYHGTQNSRETPAWGTAEFIFFGEQNAKGENPEELCRKETRSLFQRAGKCTLREVAVSRAKFSSALLMSFKLLQAQTLQQGRKQELTKTATQQIGM